MVELARFKVNAPDVVSETIDGESVIINLSTGSYYSLNQAGADIWNLIEANASLPALIGQLTQRYTANPDEIESAVLQLVEQLQKEGLIVPVLLEAADTELDGNELAQATPVAEKLNFEIPVLQTYTDMQDLLLLDPIHEVEEDAGWPSKKVA